MFEGLSVAMVTPFKNGAIDYTAVSNLVEFMIEGGVQGLVVSGSTGEAATTSFDEKRELWKFVKAQAKGRAWMVVGTGTNDTAQSVGITKLAEECGADGALVVTPYYNKPTPKGQIAHFTAVAKSTKLPIIVYNVPGRTGTNTLPGTIAQLQDLANVVAVKEASGSVDQMSQVKQQSRFTLLSGDDSLTLPVIAVGGEGIISVVGQMVPREMRALSDAARAGRLDEARALNDKLAPIFKAAFIESNPSPTKFLLSRMGICANELRLPLVPVEPSSETAILAAAEKVGVKLASAVYA